MSPPKVCTEPNLEPLATMVDVAPGGAHLVLASVSADPAVDHSHAQLRFGSFVPGATGAVGLSLSGTLLGGTSAGAAYSVGRAEATQLRQVLRTPNVYAAHLDGLEDRSVVVVAAQLHDADGNTVFETAQLTLSLTVTSASGAATTSQCSVISGSGLATCSCVVPPAWFSDTAASTASATLAVSYGGELRLTRAVGGVTLHRSPAHGALSASGMALLLPTSPRFGGDTFTARVSASLVGADYGLRAWTVRLEYDAALLSLQSYAVDGIWGDANVDQQAGTLTVLMNSPALSDESNPLVRGTGIPVLEATLLVAPGAAAGSHTAAVSLTVESMINFMTNMFVKGAAGLVLDGRDGSYTSGAVEVEVAVVRGIFAYPEGGAASLQNTAPLTGVAASKAIRTDAVSSRSGTAAFAVPATCSSEASVVLTLSGCLAQASAAATAGGAVSIRVSAEGLSLSLVLDVWFPSPISLQLDDATLNRIEGCATGGDGAYQTTRLRVVAGGLDVTPLLGTASEAASRIGLPPIAVLEATTSPWGRVARLQLRGVAAGSGSVHLVHRADVTTGLIVSETAVAVDTLSVGALTAASAELSLTPAGELPPRASFEAEYGLRQRLLTEGSEALLFGAARFSDGAMQLVQHAQLNATSISVGLEAPTLADGHPWQVRVSTRAVRDCGPMLVMQWVACGAVLAETHAEVFLQLPEPVGVRIGGAQRLAPSGDLATLAGLGEPSTGSLTATVDFLDPESGATTQRDFTLDGRTSFETSRADCTSISGNVLSALAAGCGGAQSFTVAATVDLGSFGSMTSAPRTVTLVTFSSLQLRLDASPDGPTSVTTLGKVQCTDAYQRAKPRVTATLSTGEAARDVTTYSTYSSSAPAVVSASGGVFSGAAAGTATITATFGGGGDSSGVAGVASATLLVDDTRIVNVQSMALDTRSVLGGVSGAVFDSTLAVTLTDGTYFADLHALSWLDAKAMVGYMTDVPAAVTVDADGDLTLLQNYEALVAVTVETACSPTASAVAYTAANLAVPFRGVDLGANDGLQFSVSGTSLAVPVVVNAQDAQLTSFQIVLSFDDAYLSPVSSTEGILGGSGATSSFSGTQATLNDFPLDEVLLLGNKESSFPGGRVQLATISFELVGSPSVVTRISGEVKGLITCNACDGSDENDSTDLGAITAGSGYVSLGGARRSSRALQSLDAKLHAPRAPRDDSAENYDQKIATCSVDLLEKHFRQNLQREDSYERVIDQCELHAHEVLQDIREK